MADAPGARLARIRAQQAGAPTKPPTWQAFFTGIFGDCLSHEHEQIGRCVWCKTCGRRLYAGTILTAADRAELAEALAEFPDA